MQREGRIAGSGVVPRPAREGHRDYTADPANSPAEPLLTRQRLDELHRRLDIWISLTPSRRHRVIFGRELRL